MNVIIEAIKTSMIPVRGGEMMIGNRNYLSLSWWDSLFDSGLTKVRLGDFHICDHPVTCAEWSAVMGTGTPADHMKQIPKTDVTWHAVQEFILSLNKQTGWNFRLPTEYEWEYAARGGEYDEQLSFAGNRTLAQVGWFRENSGDKIHPVSQRMPNILGLYDMSGNVWEWCQDWHSRLYKKEFKSLFSSEYVPLVNPMGPEFGRNKVIRGGSYSNGEKKCTVFSRTSWPPQRAAENIGFRLAY